MRKRIFSVYRLTNTVTRLCYVGVTGQSVKARWRIHRNAAGRGDGQPIAAAIRGHGSDAFIIDVLEQVSDFAQSRAAEVRWIRELGTMVPNGYNASAGGPGVPGMKHTAETVAKMRSRQQPASERQRRAKTMRDKILGPLGADHKARISAGLTDPANGPQRTAILLPSDGGRKRPIMVDGVSYSSITDCATALSVTPPAVCYWLRQSRGVRAYRSPIVVGGVMYPTRNSAAATLGVSVATIRRRIMQERGR